MKGIKQMRMLLSGRPPKQKKTRKKRRTVKAILAGLVIGWLLDVQEARWNTELWKPQD